MILLLIFILGLFIGSFLNVLADRLARDESFVTGRSYCESCKHVLKWYDLVPLFSFLQIGGKCRYCKTKLSWYYPITELTTGVLFGITYWHINFKYPISNIQFQIEDLFQLSTFNSQFIFHLSSFIFYLFIVSCLIVIFFADLKYYIIPDKVLLPAILITLIFNFQFSIFNQISILNYLMSALGSFLFFFLLFAITRGRGMGFGDVKYAFFMGLLLGFPQIIVGLYVAFLTGAFIALILILWGKKKLKGSTIPFGPFLVIGTLVSLFWGDFLFQYVSSILLR